MTALVEGIASSLSQGQRVHRCMNRPARLSVRPRSLLVIPKTLDDLAPAPAAGERLGTADRRHHEPSVHAHGVPGALGGARAAFARPPAITACWRRARYGASRWYPTRMARPRPTTCHPPTRHVRARGRWKAPPAVRRATPAVIGSLDTPVVGSVRLNMGSCEGGVDGGWRDTVALRASIVPIAPAARNVLLRAGLACGCPT